MSEKITVLPYAGPEVMGGVWVSTEKPSGARMKNKTNGTWKPYHNPDGAYGPRPNKKKQEVK